MGDAEYVAKQHICAGPIFVLFEPSSYVRIANLVLHKLPTPQFLSPFNKEIGSLQMCVLGYPLFPFRPTKRLDSQSILLSAPPFLIEPRPRFLLQPAAPFIPL